MRTTTVKRSDRFNNFAKRFALELFIWAMVLLIAPNIYLGVMK